MLALSLLKNDIPVRIVEKDVDYHVGERGPGIMVRIFQFTSMPFTESVIQPRTLEIEHILGVSNDIRNAAAEMPILKFHDPKNPYSVIKSSKMVEEVEPTPAFPVVR